jgi:tRNA1Val (adenine37-N6)-methyltransferase
VLCNPPYFPVSSGKSSENEKLALAREERSCTLSDVCAAGAYYTKWGGRFALIHRPERLSEVLCAMSASGLEPKRLRFVQNTAESLPSLILAEGRRGGKAGLAIEQPLILTRDGRDTEEIERIYHRKGV